jgi:hypothetical protein
MQSDCSVPINVKNFLGTPLVVRWQCNMGVPDEKQLIPLNVKNGFCNALYNVLGMQYRLCVGMDGAGSLWWFQCDVGVLYL